MRPIIAWTMIFSMALSPATSAFAAENASEKIQLKNVELSASGEATGRLVDEQGNPVAGQAIEIHTARQVEKKVTAADGTFTVKSEAGGNCAIIVGDRAHACRLWLHNTAPPKSLTTFGIVQSDGPIVRAQDDDGGFGYLGGVTGKQLLGMGLLAGAIVAVVVTLDDGS